MNAFALLAKFRTALRLAARGDSRTLRHQFLVNTGRWRLARHGGQSFVHHDPGFPFVCHPDWPDSVDQFCSNAGDHWEQSVARTWLVAGDAVVDAGASIGLYTFAAAAAVGPTGRVIAIEAAPYVHEKLKTSIALLGTEQVVPLNAALAAMPGTLPFYVRSGHRETSEQSLRPSEEQRKQSTTVEIPALTLDQIGCSQLSRVTPALVKLDIEGAENMALTATPAAWFSAEGPLWILEINPGALGRFDATPRDIIDRFNPAHFERWLLAKHRFAPNATNPLCSLPDEPASAAIDFGESLYYNFLAIPRSIRFRDRIKRIRPFFRPMSP